MNTAYDERDYRVYTSKQGAERIGSEVIAESTLLRLAREGKVAYTRNGRKVGWTDGQLAGVVAYLATRQTSKPSASKKAEKKPPSQPSVRSDIAPLESKPGSRYLQSVRTGR